MLFLDNMPAANSTKLSRRSFVKAAFCAGLMCLSPSRGWSALGNIPVPEKSLSLYNPNTREALCTTYWSDGDYVPEALAQIDYLMRDRFTGQTKPIDVNLLDLLHAISNELNVGRPLHVISGYRTSKTNALLRKCGKQTAKNSYHIQGKAVDIRVPGCRVSALHRVSAQLRAGGVGYYPCSEFVHVDVGPIRYWSGV
jgi:uncharacterized protein YcbK (DUF882 family)